MLPVAMLAHAKWFVDWSRPFPSDWEFMLDPGSITMIAIIAILAVICIVVLRGVGIADLPSYPWMARLQPVLPRLLAASLGVNLLPLVVTNSFLAPHLSLQDVTGGWVFALIEGIVGVWLIAGKRLQDAAIATGALGVIGLLLFGPVTVLEAGHMWGIAWFIWMSCGSDQAVSDFPPADRVWSGVLGLRLGLGASLVTGAVTEKLMHPSIMAAVLEAHPELNVSGVLGLGLDTATFIRFLGSVELLLGVLIMVGVTPRLVALVAAGPFIATVPLFGRTELFGHLPLYGALLVLLVYGTVGRLAPAPRPSRKAAHPPRVTTGASEQTTTIEQSSAPVSVGADADETRN